MVVAPGGEATTTLTVRNDSEIVEAYEFEVIGACAPWTVVEPARLSLYPGTSEAVVVRLRPPRSPEVRAGETPLAVRVRPAERPELATVPETTVLVQPFGQVEARLVPQRRRAWRAARFRAELRNLGNTPVSVAVEAADPAEELRLRVAPARVALDPGADAEVLLRARTRRLLWFGAAVAKPFLLTATPTATPPIEEDPPAPRELDGEVLQMPVLPRWLLVLLGLLLALLLAWFTLVRPAVRSAAREAAGDRAEEMVQAGELQPGPSARDAAGQPQPRPAGEPTGGAGETGAGQGTGGGGGGGAGAPGGAGQQSSGTIEIRTAGGASGSGAYTVPEGKLFLVTDLVLANFQGDEGVLTVVFGDRVITTIALETFRNQDYHWVTPIEIPENATVTANVTCSRPGTPATGQQAATCVEVLNVSGRIVDVVR